jgi:hypothetical protein
MADITISQITELQDPKLRAIVNRVFLMTRMAAEKAVAHASEPTNFPIAADPKSFEQIFLSRFKKVAVEKQQAAVLEVMPLVKASVAARTRIYGDLAKVNIHQATSVETQASALPLPAKLKLPPDHLKSVTNLHGQIYGPGVIIPAGPAEASSKNGDVSTLQATTNKLEFRVHKVICVDETNGFLGTEAGNDEIGLGCTSIDETGDVQKTSPFTVGNNFDDGEQKVYSPPRQLHWFNLLEGNKFPKSYFVTMILAEKDMGDLGDYVIDLMNKVKPKVKEELTKAGVAATESGPIVSLIIAAAVNFVVDKVFQYLAKLIGDDVFKPVTASISVQSLTQRFTGNKTDSPDGVATFKGYGGEYKIVYDWRLYA